MIAVSLEPKLHKYFAKLVRSRERIVVLEVELHKSYSESRRCLR